MGLIYFNFAMTNFILIFVSLNKINILKEIYNLQTMC